MINNDKFRQIRYVFNYNNTHALKIFKQMGAPMTDDELLAFMKKEEDPGFVLLSDELLCRFLDGIIIEKRGLKEGAERPKPLTELNNNMILRKLKIALQLKDDDILAALKLADFRLSKSELGALFQKPEHKNYRHCGDQILRYTIKGLGLIHREQ
ncbi:DUF1456 family protein [Shewanella sp. NIFS-20-20]|uniref:DUF1456 family protein n=1 Tax=Shewanella sp. NIFS-20-20 TaxID=2853806 RepID=UPI001C4787EC|nr:DUF1456 family protein [Shewanella sp. NIFS-20-20]MBV7315979.1 DUF1456 family protein [Shewanella sp. NIFS-20-20]